ncbi:MAG TPA: substrate-binding domain-containing protein [Fimbriimonadaceae bacterium]|jgi:ribose transport system substrate-binding protein
MSKKIQFSVLISCLVLLAGCGSSSSSDSNAAKSGSASGGKKLEIALVPKGTTHAYWKSVNEGAQKAADELGVTLDWKSSVKEDDKDGQIQVVENFVSQKVDGIGVAPTDDVALETPIKDAIAQGIPVVIFDSAIKDVDVPSFVATDNEAAGKLGGERLAKLLGGKGKVIMLRYMQGSASTESREKGALEALQSNPGIQMVSDNQFGGATADTAQSASENLINQFNVGGKFGVDGIFCPNESTAYGMLKALQNAGLAGKVKFVGFDSSDPLMDGVKAGQIDALVVQNPVKMGYETVKQLVNKIKGQPVEKRVDTGAAIIDKDHLTLPGLDTK